MIYRVKMDGNDILNFQEKEFVLLSPTLSMELNAAGSFEFTMPPNHSFYDGVRPFLSTLEVYEDESLLWFGRPVELRVDFHRQRKVYCEGALAFFNDSVQRPQEFDSVALHSFFRAVISAHNEQVDADRQFTVGQITVPNTLVYRKLDYESTFEVLKSQCVDAEGGYLFLRREDGVNYIDWMAEMPYTCNQPVEFGLNLLDMSSGFDGSSIATCVLPIGAKDAESGQKLTVASVNGGSDLIQSEAVADYGRITRVMNCSGIKNDSELLTAGIEYLSSLQFNDLVIECTAAELHLQNPNYEQFRVGQTIRCRSVPHLVDREFPLMKMTIHLDTAAKQITLGTAARQTLTRIYKNAQETGGTQDPATQGELDGIRETITEIQTQMVDLQSSSHWTHQIDGVTSETGVVNFVTVT